MRHFLQLLEQSSIQERVPMPMNVGPDGRVSIEVPFAGTVFQPCPLSGNQYYWLVVGRNPIPHRRERMPNMGFIELDEGVGGVHGEEERRSNGVVEYWSIGVLECWRVRVMG